MLGKAEEHMKILKYHCFNFCASTIKKIYISFIRPKIEYSSVVWIGINQREQDKLEQVNFSAMHVISGYKVGTSHQKLHDEIGLISLREQQLRATKIALYDAFHEQRPCRINRQSINLISQANPYSIRQSSMIRLIRCNIEASFHLLWAWSTSYYVLNQTVSPD